MLRLQATVEGETHRDQATLALCDLYVRLRSDPRYANKRNVTARRGEGPATVAHGRSTSKQPRLKRRSVVRPRASFRRNRQSFVGPDSKTFPTIPRSRVVTELLPTARTVANLGGFAAGGAFDNGWQLIELIQRVVEPDFWRERGGPGTMRYFAMRRVLVVSATTDVHEQIRDLLLILSR